MERAVARLGGRGEFIETKQLHAGAVLGQPRIRGAKRQPERGVIEKRSGGIIVGSDIVF